MTVLAAPAPAPAFRLTRGDGELFTEQDLGRPKVEAAVRELRARNSDIRITGEALAITGPAALVDRKSVV